jgi:hypothetical protein
MQTTISIEYGEDLTSQQTMHEEILRCHSHMFDLHCLKAKPLREQYAKSTAIKDRLASFVFPEVTEKQFANGAMEPKVRYIEAVQLYIMAQLVFSHISYTLSHVCS